MELSEETVEDVRLALNVSSEALLSLLENEGTRGIAEQMVAFVVEKNNDIEEYESAIQQFQEVMDSRDAEISEKMDVIERLQTRIGVLQAERSDMEEIQEQQAEQLEAEKERASEREELLSQMRERCTELESQSRDGMPASEGEGFARLQRLHVQLEMQAQEHDAEMAEVLTQLQNRCAELEQLQEEDARSVERSRLLELQQQYIDLKAQSGEHEREVEGRLAGLQERCALLETQSMAWTEERERYQLLKARHEEMESAQGRMREMVDETEERCVELEEELKDLAEELTVTREQLQQAREELRPPADIPGADREELLRLLDRRQVEISCLTLEWKELADKLETTSSAKQEIQARLDELVAQEASLRLREQLFAQEKSLIQEQNRWLSAELEGKSSEVLLARKEKDVLQAELQGKIISRDQELSLLKASLESQTSKASQLESKLASGHRRLAELRDEQVAVEDTLRRELSSQAKLASLYQSASDAAERKVDELVRGMEEMQETVKRTSQEREDALAKLEQLQEQLGAAQDQASERVSELERELARANDLLASSQRRRRPGGATAPPSEGELLSSLSPGGAAALLKPGSGLTLTQIYSRLVDATENLQAEREENVRLNNYLEQILKELDEKTPALQKLRRDHDLALRNCAELQQRLESVVEECDLMRLEGEDSTKDLHASRRENKRLEALVSDLGRQVRVLLKECEEARGGVVSTSHDLLRDLSSEDITSSSQVIGEHLVTFKTVDELQHQNQRLLAVVRELSDEKESEERLQVSKETQQLQGRLNEALRELELLREGRERQKVLVESIVKQRDMYRVLLAQSTLQSPPDTSVQEAVSRDSVHSVSGSTISPPRKSLSLVTVDSGAALEELRVQFDTYRGEKRENDRILQEQIDHYREEASSLRLDNAKVAAKLENFRERYELLDAAYNGLKKEQAALRDKERQLSDFLARHQSTIDSLTQELLAAKEKSARAEAARSSLATERDMLSESEARARTLYENLLREQRGRNMLLVNLQTLQNNLDKAEFETKARLGSQIEALEREVTLLKEKAHSDEGQRARLIEAYDAQVRDFTEKLDQTRASELSLKDALRESRESGSRLDSELASAMTKLTEAEERADKFAERIKMLEDDAGAEFRGRIRLLERKLADATAQVSSLEEQVSSTREHRDQFQALSQANEEALEEMTRVADELKASLESQIQALKTREDELLQEAEKEKQLRDTTEGELREELKVAQEVLRQAQEKVCRLQKELTVSLAKVQSSQEDTANAQEDAQKYASLAEEKQDLYQRELVQHGRTMEELASSKERIHAAEEELREARQAADAMKENLTTARNSWLSEETRLKEDCRTMKEHCQDLTQRNDLLHTESEKLLARICTLTQTVQQTKEKSTVPSVVTAFADESGTKSVEHLWELIGFLRREKEIAVTRKEMSDDENIRLTQSNRHLERKLQEAEVQLRDLSEVVKAHSSTTSQFEEVMEKVQTLNVISDSNKLLREERNSLKEKLSSSEERCRSLEADLVEVKEANVSLRTTKNSLLAEKTALKTEVTRWTTRTNQLIEQYNQVDPEEYKRLTKEREEMEAKVNSLSSERDSLRAELAEAKETAVSEKSLHTELLSASEKKCKEQAETMKQLQVESRDNRALIARLKDIGRKFRESTFEQKNEIQELKKKLEEAGVGSTDQLSDLKQLVQKLTQELDTAKKEMESLKTSAAEHSEQQEKLRKDLETAQQEAKANKSLATERQDKYDSMTRTARTYKAKCTTMKKELDEMKDKVQKLEKEIEEIKNAKKTMKGSYKAELVRSHKEELAQMQQKYEAVVKQLEEQVASLQQELRAKAGRQTEASLSQGSAVVAVHSAPTAAVKPTVTTTPTASIRPMPLQTSTAPTAHVTPTQVIPSVSTSAPPVMAATVAPSPSSTSQVVTAATLAPTATTSVPAATTSVAIVTTLEPSPVATGGTVEVAPSNLPPVVSTTPPLTNSVSVAPTPAAATVFVATRAPVAVASGDEHPPSVTVTTAAAAMPTTASSAMVTSTAATPFTVASSTVPAHMPPSTATDRAGKRTREETSSLVESPATKRARELPSSVTTAEPSTTTDQQTTFADTETASTSVEMIAEGDEQPDIVADAQTTSEQAPATVSADLPSQIQEAESVVAMVTDSVAAVTGTDDASLPQPSGDVAADTTSGAPDLKSAADMSPPLQEEEEEEAAAAAAQEGVGERMEEEEEDEAEEEVRSSEPERQGRSTSVASSGPDPLVTQEEEELEAEREPSEQDQEEMVDDEESDRDIEVGDNHREGSHGGDHREEQADEECRPPSGGGGPLTADPHVIILDSDGEDAPEADEGRQEGDGREGERQEEEMDREEAEIQMEVDADPPDGCVVEAVEEVRPDLGLPGPSSSIPSTGRVAEASDSSHNIALSVQEDSMGLPDEEIAIPIPAQAGSSMVTMATTTAAAPETVRRLHLSLVAEQRASTPGYEMSVPTLGEDHTVPCTPVLAENKQLSKAQAVQSVPAESVSEGRPLSTVSESSSVASGTGGIQSLGETQIEQLTSTTTLPLPSSSSAAAVPTRTPSPLRSASPRPVISVHVSADGALDDDAINEIIAADDHGSASSSEIEEGEVVEDAAPTTTTTDQTRPDDAPPMSSLEDADSVASSSSAAAIASTSKRATKNPRRQAATRKIERIVWDGPTSSSSGSSQPAATKASTQREKTTRRIIHRGTRPQKPSGRGKSRSVKPK